MQRSWSWSKKCAMDRDERKGRGGPVWGRRVRRLRFSIMDLNEGILAAREGWERYVQKF